MAEWIHIEHANEHNLQEVSVKIPKRKLTVITGVSGSGKSTLAHDILFNESQRQYLEAMGMQGIEKPKVAHISGASPAISLRQQETSSNPRSTVGTKTAMYTSLRMIYEKLGIRACPHCEKKVNPIHAIEVTETVDGIFTVFQICPHCDHSYKKLTRSHFSYNKMEGACSTCKGIGEVIQIDETVLFDKNLSIEQGAVTPWVGQYLDYQLENIKRTLDYYGVPIEAETALKDFNELQWALLKFGTSSVEVQALTDKKEPKTVSAGKFQGVMTNLWFKYQEKNGDMGKEDIFFYRDTCSDCHGTKLKEASRQVLVLNHSITEISMLDLDQLYAWVQDCRQHLSEEEWAVVEVYMRDIETKLKRIKKLGLGYLTLERATNTLSGGESQRIRLAAILDSDLTDVVYIIDEPTASLHAKDTEGIIKIMKELRDKGNTVLVIEHNTDVMREADYLIEIGPKAGRFGGELIGTGSLEDLMENERSLIKEYVSNRSQLKGKVRSHGGTSIHVQEATRHNLNSVTVDIPTETLVSVTGVSGSGKSSLIFDVVGEQMDHVTGLEQFEEVIIINQTSITKMKRSNIATYTNVFTDIRNVFAKLASSKEQGLTAKHFSFNTNGGRCETCEGLGYVMSNMLFFNDMEVVCPTCRGKRFKENILAITYQGYNINDCLECSVEEALAVFKDEAKIEKVLQLLADIGLGYLKLGQSLTTLSGGEGQRLKLSTSLMKKTKQKTLFLLDEPSTGLHPYDIQYLIELFNRLIEKGNSIIMVEHNIRMIHASDWVIDLGPEGGVKGGQIIAEGTPSTIRENTQSVTGRYL
ncbi:ATP-binding cassette domain-containing protein [Alkalihalobacillus pseudalcaliphilus]|uniref:ATP-binding cassette domain-containing protein n=1 Tax=Alkalihalobacillus pseudalcaliphilus TaxID=79884 RepID=UPI00064DB5B6|nr:excinuclease ABC subunit UvrA [Alkalihalobacillus pseudalcaliphilus]KMK76805.1 excinuclease ABC subunit A [Alkalihalobacillus pseudalcaliphilus]